MTAHILKILMQETVWLTADGVYIPIEMMDQTHRRNTLAYLQRRAPYLKTYIDQVALRENRQPEARRFIGMDPLEWVNSTPFVRALEKAIRDHGALDGEVVDVTYESSEPRVLNSGRLIR